MNEWLKWGTAETPLNGRFWILPATKLPVSNRPIIGPAVRLEAADKECARIAVVERVHAVPKTRGSFIPGNERPRDGS